MKASYNNQYAHHSSIPHSKSLDHYNEASKFVEHHNVSRHSFDQPFSSNYKNYDCTDGIHAAVAAAAANVDRNNGYHMNMYHQPGMYGASGNRYPATMPFPDHHYSQVAGFERGDNFVDTPCCHQNPHYECLSNFNSRSSLQKSKNTAADYSNCSFAK